MRLQMSQEETNADLHQKSTLVSNKKRKSPKKGRDKLPKLRVQMRNVQQVNKSSNIDNMS